MVSQPKQPISFYLKTFAVLIVNCLQIAVACTQDFNPVPLQKARCNVFTSYYWDIQVFLSPFLSVRGNQIKYLRLVVKTSALVTLLDVRNWPKFKGVALFQRGDTGAGINISLKQFCTFTRKGLTLFSWGEKNTVIHHINVLLSYLPMRTLSRLFRVVQPAVCWFLLLFFLYHAKEHVVEGSQVTEARLIEEPN